MKRLLSSFLIIVSVFFSVTSCEQPILLTDEEKIINRINSFTDAYNDGDFKEMLNHMTGKQKNALEAVFKLAGIFTGYDISEIFSSVFSIGIAAGDGDFMKVEISEVDIEGNKAIVTTIISFPGAYIEEAETSYFHMKKHEEEWFIVDITD